MRTTLEELNLNVVSENLMKGEYIIGPLHKGFGITIGNSLRRVLLSSIEGAAVVAVRIEGISHQFTPIEGVLEDGIQIVANIKRLVLRSHSSERKILELTKKGAGPVKASDLFCPEGIEVMNPDLVLMNIVDDAFTLNMQLYVESGIEYKLAEENREPSYPIDTFPIDSMYCPVRHVSFKVSQVMVQESLDFENLSISIETNGAIDPRTSLDQASKILVEYFRNILQEPIEEEVEEVQADDESEEILTKALDDIIPLSVRTGNVFKKAGIYTVSDLFEKTKKELLALKNFGAKSLYSTIEELLKVPEIEALQSKDRFPLIVDFSDLSKPKPKVKKPVEEEVAPEKEISKPVEKPIEPTQEKPEEVIPQTKPPTQYDTLPAQEVLKLNIDEVAKHIGISQKQLTKLKKYAIEVIGDLTDVTREQLLTGDHKVTKKNVERVEEFLRHYGLSLKED
ncbi:MAG TPA: DNA-directed RNA polymerase subunit alpha [Caldisericia bacterium]|jgi:DNA-directed RNA polymerase subunit alpha|nr:DNA-directed RNA polymerase subunit alpha [Caldisericia bacterium]HXK51342.1 DNA-directed RNA polymerase subunit alpha [Caldisericia bacterium]